MATYDDLNKVLLCTKTLQESVHSLGQTVGTLMKAIEIQTNLINTINKEIHDLQGRVLMLECQKKRSWFW